MFIMLMERHLLAEWEEKNPILKDGEILAVPDKRKIKIGNGTSKFNDLPYKSVEYLIGLEYDRDKSTIRLLTEE